MEQKKKTMSTQQVVMVGLMAALVFVGSKIEIRFPTVLGVSRFHLGNAMCLLAGFQLSPLAGGFAAGFGSFLFDLVFWGGSPVGWMVTFATKFVMAFFAGICYHKHIFRLKEMPALVLSGAVGQLAYIIGYLLKEFVTYRIVMEQAMEVVGVMLIEKGLSSLVNAVIAVTISSLLFTVLNPILKKSGLTYGK